MQYVYEGCLVRCNPDGKEYLQIDFHLKKVSSVTFGGEDYTDACVTAAGKIIGMKRDKVPALYSDILLAFNCTRVSAQNMSLKNRALAKFLDSVNSLGLRKGERTRWNEKK